MFRQRVIGFASVAFLSLSGFLVACGDDDDDDDDSGGNGGSTSPTASGGGGGIPSNLTKVTVSDNRFTPVSLQVPVGATVTWEWTGEFPHSVVGTFDGKQIQSPTLTGTGVYLEAFQKAGTFDYQCGVHGEAMKGTIVIQ